MGADHITGTNHLQAHFRTLDSAFVALVDGAFADAAARSGPHLLCRPGCTQCCIGAFAIAPADALRLKQGLDALAREDPEQGICALYASRPQTCRVFGPPIATAEGYGVCELCFQAATPEEIAGAAMTLPSDERSSILDEAALTAGVAPGATIVAFVLKD